MAKNLDPVEIDAIETIAAIAVPDEVGTAAGPAPDAPTDTITVPLSLAEAARHLGAHPDTLRKRWMPRILEAVEGTAIADDVMVEVGRTKAGNPILKLSPLGYGLLAEFQSVAGDVDAIAQWQVTVRDRHPLPFSEPVEVGIEPEGVEDVQPWERAGALAIAPRSESALAVDADWTATVDEAVEADWQGIQQAQMSIANTITTGGSGLVNAMRMLARSHVAEAANVYQSELTQGLSQVLGGNLAAVTGHPQGQNPSAAAFGG